jgi:alpha-beta hydrolase superfamily lysophospholipase
MTLLAKIILSAAIGIGGTLVAALALIASDRPAALVVNAAGGLDFTRLPAGGAPTPLRSYTARDGTSLGYRRWDSAGPGAPLVVAVHGSGWHGAQFQALGAALAGQGLADVVAPDLRGHGPDPARRGDIDHIGQFEQDLADLIAATAKPGQKVVMLGHSSGGGLVLRHAGAGLGQPLDGAILLAPFLQYDAPTTRPNSGGWARVMTRRIIGLSILNTFRITALNGLTVTQFHFPAAVLDGPLGATATTAYSYRLMTGYAPHRDWHGDVAALPPFLLVAGDADEAFRADLYQPTLAPLNPQGTYWMVPSGHLDVVDHPETMAAITAYLGALR